MNLKLNMKNFKMTHFQMQILNKNDVKKEHIFAKTSLGSFFLMPSLLPHVLWGKVIFHYIYFCKCNEPSKIMQFIQIKVSHPQTQVTVAYFVYPVEDLCLLAPKDF